MKKIPTVSLLTLTALLAQPTLQARADDPTPAPDPSTPTPPLPTALDFISYQNLMEAIRNSAKEFQIRQSSATALQSSLSAAQAELAAKQTEQAQLNSKLSALTSELTALETQIAALHVNLGTLEQQDAKVNAFLARAQMEDRRFEDALDRQNREIERFKNGEYAPIAQRFNEAVRARDAVRNEIGQANAEIRNLQERERKLNSAIDEQKREVAKSQKNRDEAQTKLNESSTALNDAQTRLTGEQQTLDAAIAKYNELDALVAKLTRERNKHDPELKAAVGQRNDQERVKKNAKNTVEKTKEEISDLQKRVRKTTEHLAEIDENIAVRNKKISDFDNEKSNIPNAIEAHKTQIRKREPQLPPLENAVKAAKPDFDRVSGRMDDMRREFDATRVKRAGLRQDMLNAEAERTRIIHEVRAIREGIAVRNARRNQIPAEQKTINTSLDSVKSQITAKQAAVNTLEGPTQQAQSDLRKAKKDLDQSQASRTQALSDLAVQPYEIKAKYRKSSSSAGKYYLTLTNKTQEEISVTIIGIYDFEGKEVVVSENPAALAAGEEKALTFKTKTTPTAENALQVYILDSSPTEESPNPDFLQAPILIKQ